MAGRFLLGGREIVRTGDDGPLDDGPPWRRRRVVGAGDVAAAARVTPAVLFITVVLAVVLLASGLLHVLRRLFLKSHAPTPAPRRWSASCSSSSASTRTAPAARAGLDQAAIDALPAFTYAELLAGAAAPNGGGGTEEAVRLRRLPLRVRRRRPPPPPPALRPRLPRRLHRHLAPLQLHLPALPRRASARALAALAAAAADTPAAAQHRQPDVEDQKLDHHHPPPPSDEPATSFVLSVRLGRFKNTQRSDGDADASGGGSRCIDARRCYSMGSYQYVLADDNLLISVHWRPGDGISAATAAAAAGANVATARTGIKQGGGGGGGKKVFGRGDSFSMSKIWQWRGGDRRFPVLHSDASPPADDGLPWATAAAASTRTRQESDT